MYDLVLDSINKTADHYCTYWQYDENRGNLNDTMPNDRKAEKMKLISVIPKGNIHTEYSAIYLT